MTHYLHHTLKPFQAGARQGQFYSLPELAKTYPNVNRLPVAIRIVLESVLRNCDGQKVTAAHVEQLANWQPNTERVDEIPFVVARVVLQDFTGVPLLADLDVFLLKRATKDFSGNVPFHPEFSCPANRLREFSAIFSPRSSYISVF